MWAWLGALILLLGALVPRAAQAAETDAAAAEVLFQKGREAMSAEDYDAACRFFQESLSLDQAVGTVMNLAVCEEKRGHLTSSWERWRQALQLLDPSDDRVLFAEDQLSSISERLAQLTIRLTGASAKEVTIRRDGVILGAASLGQELPADPGKHVVTVESERFEPRQYSVTLASGEHAELTVSPGPAKPRAVDPASARSANVRRTAAYVAFGVGAAGIAAAIITGALLPAQDQKVEDNCPGRICNPVGAQAISDAQTLLVLNTVGWITAGVGIAAGTVLVVTLPRTRKQASAQSPSVSVGVTTSGLLVRGQF
jgi:hypothetical protein